MSKRRPPATPLWLVLAALATCLPFLGKHLALDEESYLWIAARFDPTRPYAWARAWPPWDATDGFVYAHPPLHLAWMALFAPLADSLWLVRVLAGAPFVALYAWAVARLAAATCHHPGLAAGVWLASTTVLLGLHDSLMIDLPACALATAAVAAWREGQREEATDARWQLAAGALIGLALATKYSMLMVAAPLALHALRRRRGAAAAALALGVFVAVEAAVFVAHGRVHLLEVWLRRGEIEAGPLAPRLLGTLARAALLPLPLALVVARPTLGAVGLGLAVAALAWARPAGLGVGENTGLLALTALGGTLFARGLVAAAASRGHRRKGDRDDAFLLGAWLVAVFLGVTFGHNYASARYLLPASAPAALLLVRAAEEVRGGKAMVRASILISAVVGGVVAVADARFAAAGDEVARSAVARVEERGDPPGRFAGEWSFRAAMERSGWTRYRPGEALAAGTVVIVAENASPGTVPVDAWEPIDLVESRDLFRVRVVDAAHDVSLHAETLGVMPLGWRRAPLEAATIWRVR